MSFLRSLFSFGKKTDSTMEKKESLPVGAANTVVLDPYTRMGLTYPISEEEKEIVSVIVSSVMAGDSPDSKFKVKNVVGIDADKVTAAVITSAIASSDSPNSTFMLRSVKELNVPMK